MNHLQPSSVDFSVLFERDLDAAVVVDAAQKIHHINTAFTRLFGYTREDAIGRNIDDLIVPPELRAEAIDFSRRSERGCELSLETTRRAKDGRIVDVWVVASPCDAQDGHHVCYVQYRDITERVRAVEELNRKRSELRTIVEHAPIGIALIDLDHVLFEANAALENMLGHARGGLIGCNMSDMVHVGEREKVLAIRDELLRTNATVRLTTRMLRSDASQVWVRVTASVIRSTFGEPRHLMAVIEDVTQQLALEASLLELQKAEAVGKLAGGIAHDFNNILTALQGHALLLLDEAQLDEQGRADVEEIVRGANRAAKLTRQLLAYSRRQKLNPAVVSINDAIRAVGRTLKTAVGETICLELMLDDHVPRVRMDPGQLEQVLLHLVVNARDAMPGGGLIRISTERRDLSAALIAGIADVAPGQYAEIIIQDNGKGMDAATASRVFDPFFTTKEPGHGTGLGLSMAYGIVKQSGGTITVESEVGERTSFRILLPRSPDEGE